MTRRISALYIYILYIRKNESCTCHREIDSISPYVFLTTSLTLFREYSLDEIYMYRIDFAHCFLLTKVLYKFTKHCVVFVFFSLLEIRKIVKSNTTVKVKFANECASIQKRKKLTLLQRARLYDDFHSSRNESSILHSRAISCDVNDASHIPKKIRVIW